MYSSAKFGRFKSNCMTVAPPSWVEVIYVIPLYEVSRGLNLNLSSVCGRSLKLTDYYRAEARRYLPDQAKTEAETMRQSRGRGNKVETEARPCEAEARPSQLKNCLKAASSRGRCRGSRIHPWYNHCQSSSKDAESGV